MLQAKTQFVEQFNDGELNNNPAWIYNSSDFEVLAGRLKTLNADGGSVKYGISALYNSAADERFEFTFQFQFNPSSQNYAEFYIAADTLSELTKNGYFIRCGDLKDEISFYRLNNGTRTELISGTDGELNKTNSQYSVRLDRISDTFFLYYKPNGSNVWTLQGKAYEPVFSGGKYTGLHVVQNGTSVIGKHFFDDFYLGPREVDTLPPKMLKARFAVPNMLEVQFNEAVYNPDTLHFSINLPSVRVISARSNAFDNSKVEVVFSSPLPVNKSLTLSNVNTRDADGNASRLHSIEVFTLKAEKPHLYDLFFTEVMANPTPKTGSFPEAEYVEIWNPTNKYLSLAGCLFSDASSSVLLPDSFIAPHTYLILSRNTFPGFAAYGPWIGLASLPSLNNDEDYISIANADGEIVCSLNYKESWHSDDLRKAGGWSLELIDTTQACLTPENWISNNGNAGTPGQINSVAASLKNPPEPSVFHVFCDDPVVTTIYFSLPVDNVSASNVSNYQMENGAKPAAFLGLTAEGYAVKLQWPSVFVPNKVEKIIISGVKTCTGRDFPEQTLHMGRADSAVNGNELKLNEILFDPRPEGFDYVELVNTGSRIIKAGDYYFAALNDNGTFSGTVKLPANRILLPGEYLLLTTDVRKVQSQYPQHAKAAMEQTASLPTMSNDAGFIAIADNFGTLQDTFRYKDDFHTAVLADKEGVSLEKINPGAASWDYKNWTSAASTAGYGTPGLPNSQIRTGASTNKEYFSRSDKYFSPDNDGVHDVLSIDYTLPSPGFFLTATVYSDAGFETAKPFNNLFMEQSGTLYWDGNTTNAVIKAGNYVMLMEAWNEKGEKLRQKLTFSVNAR
jgi:hypothetical protein